MADCESLQKCPFFNNLMASMPETSERMKNKYCRDQYATCARYMVSKQLGKEKVPSNLFPHQLERAKELIKQG